MLGERIEAVFENGIFRPLQPVDLPEHQRVTLLLPPTGKMATDLTPAGANDLDRDVGYEPIPLEQVRNIHVRLRPIDGFGPVPYAVEADDLEQE